MKILVVDRVKLFQKIIASVLDKTDIDYAFAETGASALTTLEKEFHDDLSADMIKEINDYRENC